MTAFSHDILLIEEYTLVEVGIEVVLHQRIRDIGCPTYEVIHPFLRTISIINLQSVTLCLHIVAHSSKTLGSLSCNQCYRLLITIDTLAYKVICSVIAYLQNGIGNSFGQGYELTPVVCYLDHCAQLTARCAGSHYGDHNHHQHLFHFSLNLSLLLLVDAKLQHLIIAKKNPELFLTILLRQHAVFATH